MDRGAASSTSGWLRPFPVRYSTCMRTARSSGGRPTQPPQQGRGRHAYHVEEEIALEVVPDHLCVDAELCERLGEPT